MDGTAHLGAEHVVHETVLRDAAETRELRGDDGRAEVVAAARPVLHLGGGARQGGLDAGFQLFGAGHTGVERSAAHPSGGAPSGTGPGVAILREAMSTQVTYNAKGITFSEVGAVKVKDFLEQQQADLSVAGLRVGVKGGGCSGFQYQLAFDEQRDDDVVFEDHGVRILVDSPSLPYVDGSQIDYVEAMTGAGFQVVNPNVVAACGCGSSFRVADEEEVSAV